MTRCPRCGNSDLEPAARFCGVCGQFLLKGFSGTGTTQQYVCEGCGEVVLGASRFCVECGDDRFIPLLSVMLMECNECHSTSRKEKRCLEEGCNDRLRIGAPIIRKLARGGIELYHVEAFLGQGGLGAVYRVHDQNDNLRALKEMRPSLAANSSMDLGALLRNEAVVMAMLKGLDPFCQSYGYFSQNGDYFIVLELVPGKTLKEEIEERLTRSSRPFSAIQAYRVLTVFSGIAQLAHQKGVILRDIKAGNLMQNTDTGAWKMIDFGLAYAGPDQPSLPGLVGSIGYAPAEQWKSGITPCPWWDVHALCALGFYLVTGVSPETLDRENPRFYFPHDINASFAAVLQRGFNRYIQTPEELIRELRSSSTYF